ncbi:MAG: NADH-quinone oxidoreductase subunit NuoE [Ruminococcus sp.]|nr:NADH-quinone oxidoreductase subunit NuoE [Ruminococcus sp.]
MNEKSLNTFKGTIVQERQLKEVIANHHDQQGGLMPILQEAQEIYGYLPIEVQTMIADGLGISLSEVYGVATFYSQFSLTPKGEHQISVCLGTACYVKGSDKILEAVEKRLGIKSGECTPDGLFSIDSCRCVGACGLAPVMMVDDDVYGKVTPEQVDSIIDSYLAKKGGKRKK